MAGKLLTRFLAMTVAAGALAGPAHALDLPFGLGGRQVQSQPRETAPPVLMAQMGDSSVRISQMEEEMRRLTGKVEELSFLVLQLQEQLRKTQEDNEFRFQDLEKGGKSGGASQTTPQRRSEAQPALPAAGAPASEASSRVASATPSTMNEGAARPTPSASAAPASAQGGDEIGALIGEGFGNESAKPAAAPAAAPQPNVKTASIKANGPGELYGLGYNHMLSGDYALAEQTFRQYTQTYPNSGDAADAQYWLGESLYAQAKYREAAEVFLNAQKAHPQAPKAPEMMLKLGMSLVHLDNRETACITYAEIGKRYPTMSANVKRKLQAEEKTARCS
ncbi:tol-pal system protein YbgF [Aureimonas ureilytica]|nr:tol-pal system protein YbgF [Aureimonas ureilytica]